MKKLSWQLSILCAVLLLFMACKKELSLEGKGLAGTAQGSLTDSSGKCKDALVKGNYIVDATLTDSNYVVIKVNFSLQGKYKIYSDTVNGMWFVDSGFALTTGASTIKLKGYGKPILPNLSDFVLTYNGSYCSFRIVSTTSGSQGTNNDYFPTTTGSNWTYQYIPKLGSVDTFSVTIVPGVFTYDNKNYFQFQTSLQQTYYFAKDGVRTYYALSSVDFDYTQIFDSLPNYYITYPFLKDTAVGATWESIEMGKVKLGTQIGVTKAIFTVADRNPHAVLGKTFSDVINMKREIWFKPDNGTFRKILEGNSYYAKKVGLVDQVIPLSTTTSVAVSLKSSTIK